MGEPDTILVVDDDVDIARFIEVNLRLEGYRVLLAHDGATALRLVEEHMPALAVVDWMMPQLDGIELTRRLRADPMTAPIPVILLTARGQTADKVIGLQAGADDYLVKPFDTLELVARVRSTLRRNQENREVSPLTGLPGNSRILREITDRARAGVDFAVSHVDIDRFKAVNDVYGFARGDEFITALARALHRAVVEVGLPPAFLGHIGGDDFLVVCSPDQLKPMASKAILEFQTASDALYDPVDAERGYVEVVQRNGEVQQANLVTLSIGVAIGQIANGQLTDPREVIAIATDMKSVAKKHNGNYVAVDRRSALHL
ncbi:response regulator [Dactylosporangium siamense]|uniref:Diguanylate cyclase response regulator n=1 Tax=Dactylosporangium siamense TaxID=685454 RepID=A0A919UAQ8_9ACTN|nr:response regulator [Dactylosporangium siamense]GIG48297.1 diguanylate cyclase response regulator [Dactylosporangium siamense]